MRKIKSFLHIILFTFFLTGSVRAETDQIRFAYYDQFEPFSWSQNGQMQGLFIDILDELFENRLGIEVIHEGAPWRRAQQMVKDGLADGMCTVATDNRLEYTNASSVPLVGIYFRVFTSANHPDIQRLSRFNHLDDFKDFTMVDIAGSGWAAANLKDMDVLYADSYEQLFQMLLLIRADASTRNDWQTEYLIRKLGFSNDIMALPKPITAEPIEYTILINKDSDFAPLMKDVEEALIQMEQDGVLQTIQAKYIDNPDLKN